MNFFSQEILRETDILLDDLLALVKYFMKRQIDFFRENEAKGKNDEIIFS